MIFLNEKSKVVYFWARTNGNEAKMSISPGSYLVNSSIRFHKCPYFIAPDCSQRCEVLNYYEIFLDENIPELNSA